MHSNTASHSQTSGYAPDAVARVLAGSFRLLRGEMKHLDWMAQLAELTGADGTACFTWQASRPGRGNIIAWGSEPALPEHWQSWLETALADGELNNPLHVQDQLAVERRAENAGSPCGIDQTRHIVVVTDTTPTRTVFCLTRARSSAPWSAAEHRDFLDFAVHIRESFKLHKHIDGLRNIGVISNAVFNSSPRGMMLLAADGTVPIANLRAEQLTTRGDGISIRNGRIRIADPAVMSELSTVLSSLDELPREELHERRWFWSVAGDNREIPYQLALHVIPLPTYHLETSFADRVALLFVNDPTSINRPSSEELRKFYGLTRAQARLALALWGGMSIKEAAAELSISINTARCHLRSIYATTGTRSHAGLMSLLTATMVRNEFGPRSSVAGRPMESDWAPVHPDRESW